MNKHLKALGRLKVGQMNKTEAAYNEVLKDMLLRGVISWYKFEGMKFRLADNTFYTPDFAVMLTSGEIEIHEVKGSMRIFADDAKVKIKVAADIYPFNFYVITPKLKKDGGGFDQVKIGI